MCLNRDEEFLKMMKVIEKINKNIKLIKADLVNINSDYFQLINKIESEVKNNEKSISELREPFLLFIIGSGNYGKSTLINSLIKEEITETTNLPNTWKIDIFIKSKKEKVEITYDNDTKKIKSLKEGLKLIKSEELKYKESKKKVSKLLYEYKNIKKMDIEDLKSYKIMLENKFLYQSKITQIKYHIDKGNILDDFIIVDTPGLNQTLLSNTLDRVRYYYQNSDGIIWMIDAQNLVSRENNSLIDEIERIESLSPEKKRIIGVINKMDIVSMNNIDNIAKVKKRAKELYENKFDELVFISAKNAIDGMTSGDKELVNISNIKELVMCIDRKFKVASEENQVKSKHKNMYLMRNKVCLDIHNYKRILYNDISKYNESVFEQKNKIKQILNYTNQYIKSLIKKDYIINKDIIILKNEIEEFQNIYSLKLNKLYEHLIHISNFSKDKNIKKIDLNLFFTKSRYLVLYHYPNDKIKISAKSINPIENIINKFTSNALDKEKNINKYKIKNNIEKLGDEIFESINEKINLMEKNINEVRYNSFKNKHIEFSKTKEHIEYLNEIENIIKNLR